MSLQKGKHITKEIDGTYCTVIESGVSEERMKFLKELLEFNGLEVKVAESKAAEGEAATYELGVTDLVFNPVIAVYEKALKRPDGKVVSPAYWNQQKEIDDLPYFDYREKNKNVENIDDFKVNPWSYRTA